MMRPFLTARNQSFLTGFWHRTQILIQSAKVNGNRETGCKWVHNKTVATSAGYKRASRTEAAFYFAPKDAPRRKHRNYCTFQLLQWCLPGIPCRMDVSRGKRKIATGCDSVAA